MADSSPDPTMAQRPGIPRWVKVIGIVLLAVVVLALVVMFVGGGQHGPGMHAGSGGGSPSPSSTAGATADGVGEPADAAEATRTVEVTTLDSMTFEPSTVSVGSGEIVTFVVTNAGQGAHEFTLGDAAMQEEHAAAMAHMPEGMAHDLPNSVALQPGETKRLTWRFGHAGAVEYACHEPGHYQAGMRGQLTVG
jgi:uncharacterized cupredoxin-like copper-binding protein